MTVNMKNWQELKKPNALEIKPTSDGKRKATFVAEPLERGFGLTLGNALRRVLLSSLQGAAVTSIKIENVLHEFSSLAGVREDVTDIVLNIKQVALRMEGEGPKRLQLSATGPAVVKAGDISVVGDIEVMNPDLIICHLDQGATLNMELTADIGKGYVPAVANRPADAPIGLIPIDALYSPVRQVAYKVDKGGAPGRSVAGPTQEPSRIRKGVQAARDEIGRIPFHAGRTGPTQPEKGRTADRARPAARQLTIFRRIAKGPLPLNVASGGAFGTGRLFCV